MNCCTFTGYLLEDPQIASAQTARYCVFDLVTYEYRKNRAGQKQRIPTTLTFQAWDSGADAIAKLGKKGMKMTIYASARHGDSDNIMFRVNQFDFGCLDKE